MKSLNMTPKPFVLGLAILAITAATSLAQTTRYSYVWDPNSTITNITINTSTTSGAPNGGTGVTGGNGTWSTTDTTWYAVTAFKNPNTDPYAVTAQTPDSVWDNALSPVPVVYFASGGNGTVTVSGTNTVGGINVGTNLGTAGASSYTITGGTLSSSVGGTSSWLTLSNAANVTVDSSIAFTASGGQKFNLGDSGSANTMTINGGINYSNASNTNFVLTGFNAASQMNITGNITRSAAGTIAITVGEQTGNTHTYRLAGNNTGISSTITVNKGNLYFDNSNAAGNATGITVADVNAGSADTANVYIGVAGVTINKNITYNTINATSGTSDVRILGSDITSGNATFSGTVTMGAQATSGNGSFLQLTAASGGTTIFSGQITDGANTSAIRKVGNGTVILSRAAGNTYDGGTTVAAGTLLVNNTSGSGTGTGNVTVNSGATLGGNGTISGTLILSGGTLSPGNSPGLLTVGALSSSANSTIAMEISNTTRGTAYDALNVTSGGAVAFGGNLTLSFTNVSAFADNTTFDLFSFDTTSSGDFSGITSSGFAAYSGLTWTKAGEIWSATALNSQTLSFSEVTGDLQIVPEPATWALLALSLTAVVVLRRRKIS